MILFGGFWAGIIAGLSALGANVVRRKPPIRVVFNVGQSVAAVVSAGIVLDALTTGSAAVVINGVSRLPFDEVLRAIGAFLVCSATYFAVNSAAVGVAVSLSSGKTIRDGLGLKTFGFLGYDLLASLLSPGVAWVYLSFNSDNGLSRLVLVAIFLPVILARHMYGKLNTLQMLYVELDRAHEKLELSLREQLETMVRSIEARDPYTSGHSRRVSALSRAIASDLGLGSDLVEEIETAALLHDVGKIHAEFAPLLQKEGRLTQDEWEIMKTHSAKSAELVALFSRFQGNVQSSVRSHHERWDGKGYPDGVIGDLIPLGARIIMISDTIDAMTTDRPYRKALPFDKVVAELQKYRGSQFDPAIVDVTISSVTVRRLVSDREFLAEQTAPRGLSVGRPRPALRSQSSFLEAVRVGHASES
ncbi:MAG: HD-GYP domain-containing protein [Gemmatimonadales bacterium]